MKDTIILGAGAVGRLAHAMCPNSLVLEARPKEGFVGINQLFGTNYLWEDIPGFDTMRMKVVTHVDGFPATEKAIQRYKNKIGKGHETSSDWGLQFQPTSTGYFIKGYPDTKDIHYDERVLVVDLEERYVITESSNRTRQSYRYRTLISTIPLPMLVLTTALHLKYPVSNFTSKPVYVYRTIPEEMTMLLDYVYVNYVSDPTKPYYRYCDRFGERHYEALTPYTKNMTEMKPGKIWYNAQAAEILSLMEQHNVFCFGRYGRWESNQLLHESYEHLKAIFGGKNGRT